MKKKFSLIFIVSLLFCFASCEKEESVENTDKLQVNNVSEYAVSIDEAIIFAQNFISKNSKLKSARKVKRIQELDVPLKNKKLIVVDFEPSGFVILSDNKLNIPVLAYSETDLFNYSDFSEMNPSIKFWLNKSVDLNLEIENDTTLQRLNNVIEKWDRNLPDLKGATVIDPLDCTVTLYEHVINIYDNALLSSVWHQRLPYNSCMNDCSSTGEPYPAGCVAIAVGQVMNFWEYPSSFEWSSIYDEYSPNAVQDCSLEIAELIEDIGDKVNMYYTCGGSASGPSYAEGALYNDYNYDDVTLQIYSFSNSFRNNLKWGYPVLFFGEDPDISSGHAWVCDGLREEWDEMQRSCPHPNGPIISYFPENFTYYLHMNWGWENENSENTWYWDNNITMPIGKNHNYNDDVEVIINIYP